MLGNYSATPEIKTPPVIAVDIGGTKIAAGLVTLPGEMPETPTVQFERRIPTNAQEGAAELIRRVTSLIGELIAEASRHDIPVTAIGLGTAGQVDPASGSIIFATDALPGWKGTPVRALLEEAYHLPAFVDNDGHVMALGEAIYGAGRGCRHLIGMTVGTGVGGGVIIDRRIYHGALGVAGNIGHTIIDYHSRVRCPCGRFGCLEAFASSDPIVQDFLHTFGRRRISRDLGLDPSQIGVKEIATLAEDKHSPANTAALAALRKGAYYLGVGIATLINLFNPDVVVVGGGVALSGALYFPAVRQAVFERALPNLTETPILPASLGSQANLIGAAHLAWTGIGEKPPSIPPPGAGGKKNPNITLSAKSA